MTINELLERLEELRDELGGDVEVRLMTQHNWPFENALAGIACLKDIREEDARNKDDDDNPETFDADGDATELVYLLEGQQLGYGTKTAWEVAR